MVPKILIMARNKLLIPEFLIFSIALLSFHFCEQTGHTDRRMDHFGISSGFSGAGLWNAGIPSCAYEYEPVWARWTRILLLQIPAQLRSFHTNVFSCKNPSRLHDEEKTNREDWAPNTVVETKHRRSWTIWTSMT